MVGIMSLELSLQVKALNRKDSEEFKKFESLVLTLGSELSHNLENTDLFLSKLLERHPYSHRTIRLYVQALDNVYSLREELIAHQKNQNTILVFEPANSQLEKECEKLKALINLDLTK